MKIFWNKYEHKQHLTDDPILQHYKFTNVYRACDRVSQYLINEVINKDSRKYRPEDMLLRILVFKVFNKIETWDFLSQLTDIAIDSFNVEQISKELTKRQKDYPIFSNAYMMAGSHARYKGISTKHQVWLQMIEDEFIKSNGFKKILHAKSMTDVYEGSFFDFKKLSFDR